MATTEKYLSEVCELLIDSSMGCGETARRAEDPRLKKLLQRIERSRVDMIAKIANTLERSGRVVPTTGTLGGTLHLIWMGIREVVSPKKDTCRVDECARTGSALISRYDQLLQVLGLPEDLRAVLGGQRAELVSDLIELRSAKRAFAKA